ncbi:MAG: bacillithiol system redox-active protein YtxJ [Firmicutes bacterium]|nr:bacillithiol system redox-active protein YtxJ [Bacillota bacterium]
MALNSEYDIARLMQESARRPVLVFKHSSACARSARAFQEWQAFLHSPEAAQAATALVWVLEQRGLSQALARRLGVPHASPQALLVRHGRAVWTASHEAITCSALRAAVRARGAG